MQKYGKFAVLIVIIVGSLLWLATAGIQNSTTYYKSIAELRQMGSGSQLRNVRVGGDVAGESIVHEGTLVKFNLVQDKEVLRVAYEGRDPLPDTFRGGAQALAAGRMGPDGVFHASEIQAKCASKYAPKPGMAPEGLQPKLKPAQVMPALPGSTMRSSL